MNERVPLSFLLAQNADEQPPVEPIVPFPAMLGEDVRIVTAVLERTAVLASTTDQYDRITRRHDQVLVDPAMVEWRSKTSEYDGARVRPAGKSVLIARHRQPRKQSPWNGAMVPPAARSEELVAVRAASDARALKNQGDVAAAAERARRIPTAQRQKEELVSETKVCVRCKKEKSRKEFSRGLIRADRVCTACKEVEAQLKGGEASDDPPVGQEAALEETVQLSPAAVFEEPRKKRKYTRRKPLAKLAKKQRETPAPASNGHASLSLKDLITLTKKVRVERDALIAERDALRRQVEHLEAEKAEIFKQLQEAVG